MNNTKKYRILSVLLVVQWLVIQLISKSPDFVENYYSTGIYPYISRFFRFLFGWISFSFGDVIYIVLSVLILRFIMQSFRKKRVEIVKITGLLSIIYFCFHFFWGINYLRRPLYKTLDIRELNYSTDDLEKFTYLLIDKINKTQIEITDNDTVKVALPFSKKEIYNKVQDGYNKLSKKHPQFMYQGQSLKHSMISLPMTYLGTSGYLNPFTGEAQVNSLNPSISYASISCHEVAHQLGYAAENEANFIGFMSSINNENIYFQYSGYYMGLRYALNDLYRHDKEKYKIAIQKVNKGILKNMKESQEFWQGYQNSIEPYSKKIFDLFLKANKQTAGIKSYSLMVGMLINYNKENPNELYFLN
jgi:hypothetical protein